ncbi:MAG TPA: single-stranded DNA-binding protein [Candidatus Binataceae bacterium]|nr:single-stranded DNA-binding protein [Candidatus Binataceae bacterium]
MSVNKAILVGRLGSDPEVRYTNSQQAVANFNIATSEFYQDRSGQRQERTEWHKIVVWGKQAELCAQYLKKGREVYVEGRIQTRSYEAKDGSGKRYVTEIVAQRVNFLGGRTTGDQPDRGVMASGGPPDDVAPMDDEDIPF